MGRIRQSERAVALSAEGDPADLDAATEASQHLAHDLNHKSLARGLPKMPSCNPRPSSRLLRGAQGLGREQSPTWSAVQTSHTAATAPFPPDDRALYPRNIIFTMIG